MAARNFNSRYRRLHVTWSSEEVEEIVDWADNSDSISLEEYECILIAGAEAQLRIMREEAERK